MSALRRPADGRLPTGLAASGPRAGLPCGSLPLPSRVLTPGNRRPAPSASIATLGLALGVAVASSGCVHKGFFSDGTSVSYGRSTRGVLLRARQLPVRGPGYQVPALWQNRDSRYAVDELVEALQRAAAHIDEKLPGGTLGIGDLSFRRGGRATHHRSHKNGRDADLIFFAVDDQGRPLPPPPDAMPRYGRHLQSRPPRDLPSSPISPRRFDLPRNWELVATLLQDPAVDVEYLFVSEPLRDQLLEFAAGSGAPEALLARARGALRTPGRHALPHDDHLHLRVRCSASDAALGCLDAGRFHLHVEQVPAAGNS